jgi:hypothetical protein
MSVSKAEPKTLFDGYKNTLTNLQNLLHQPRKDNDPIHSVFITEFRRSTWYFKQPEKLISTPGADDEIIYKTNPKYHGLIFTDINVVLPSIKCNDNYTARWTQNIGSNIIEKMRLKFNDTVIQECDYISQDMHTEALITSEDRRIRKENMGNVNMLMNWNQRIPSYPISYTLNTFYSESVSKCFPLYLCGFFDRLEHCLKIRNKIEDLLCVKDSNEHFVLASPDTISKIGNSAAKIEMTIPNPVVWGEYVYMSDTECNEHRRSIMNTDDEKKIDLNKRNMILIENIISHDSPNSIDLGQVYVIKIPDTCFPVHRISWVAQNQTALNNKYYSNYSTDANDHNDGWDPIEHTSIDFGGGYSIVDMPSFRTNRVYPSRELAATPECKGFNYWSMSTTKSMINPPPGIRIINGNISVKLRDTNPLIDIMDDVHPSNDKFFIRVRLSVYKVLVFNTFPNNESSRGNFTSDIIMTGFN